jgi:transcriptional regulator with XRE-family HTH domain
MLRDMADTTALQKIIGQNIRAIRERHGVTQAELARQARRYGLRWNATRVSSVEAGRSLLALDALLTLSVALDVAVRRGPGPYAVWHSDGTRTYRKGAQTRVLLSDLVRHDGFVGLTDELTPTGDAVAAYCAGKTWEVWDTADDVHELLSPAAGMAGKRYRMRVSDLRDMQRRSDTTEARMARTLEIDTDELLAICWRLWSGRTFSEERDRRCGPGGAARRGPVSRQLRAEIEEELSRGND